MANNFFSRGDSIAGLIRLGSLVAIALGAFGIAVGAVLLYGSMRDQLAIEQAGRAASEQQRVLADALSAVQATLRDPQVQEFARRALQAEESGSAALTEAVRARGIGSIIDLRVFPAELEEVPLGEYPEPDFTVVEMLLEARRDGSASTRVHYPGSGDENLAFAHAINNGERRVGVLMLRAPVSLVTSVLQPHPAVDQMLLVQSQGGRTAVLKSVGGLGATLQSMPLPRSQLELRWGRRTLFGFLGAREAVIVGASGLLLLMIGLLVRRRTRVHQLIQAATPSVPLRASDQARPSAGDQAERDPPHASAPVDRPAAARSAAVTQPGAPDAAEVALARPSNQTRSAGKPPPIDLPDWLLDADQIDPIDQDDLPAFKDEQSGKGSRPVKADHDPAPDNAKADFESPDRKDNQPPAVPDTMVIAADQSEVDGDEVDTANQASDTGETTEAAGHGPVAQQAALSEPAAERPAESASKDLLEPDEELSAALGDRGSAASNPGSEPKPEPQPQSQQEPSPASETPAEVAMEPASGLEPGPELQSEGKPQKDSQHAGSKSTQPASLDPTTLIEPGLFLSAAIAGLAEEAINPRIATLVGAAIGSEAIDRGIGRVALARDGRHYSALLLSAVKQGLTSSGIDVLELGAVPAPVLHLAAEELAGGSSVLISGAHHAPHYNGLWVRLAGQFLHTGDLRKLCRRIEKQQLHQGKGAVEEQVVADRYLTRFAADIQLERPLKVVVDCANGVVGSIAPAALTAIGADVIALYADIDGEFPNHEPNPAAPANLEDLRLCVKNFQADLGLAFDGDGRRLAVVSPSGEIIHPDQVLMLLADDLLARHPGGSVVLDAACSTPVRQRIEQLEGRVIVARCAAAFVAETMAADNAMLGGTYSGHLFIAERWFQADDAIYAGARLLEFLAADARSPDELFAELPRNEATGEIRLALAPDRANDLIMALIGEGEFDAGTPSTVDGLRVDFTDGWGLVRASHSSPDLILRFEGEDGKALNRIKTLFKQQIKAIDPDLKLVF